MNYELFIKTVVHAGLELNKTIEAVSDRMLLIGTITDPEILEELTGIRDQLACQISIALETDGLKLLRDFAAAELEANRALLRASGALI